MGSASEIFSIIFSKTSFVAVLFTILITSMTVLFFPEFALSLRITVPKDFEWIPGILLIASSVLLAGKFLGWLKTSFKKWIAKARQEEQERIFDEERKVFLSRIDIESRRVLAHFVFHNQQVISYPSGGPGIEVLERNNVIRGIGFGTGPFGMQYRINSDWYRFLNKNRNLLDNEGLMRIDVVKHN